MFTVARFDPSKQDANDKKEKLAFLNNRLKRKRTEDADPSQTVVQASVEPAKTEVPIGIKPPDSDSPSKKPHREKKKKHNHKNNEESEAAANEDSGHDIPKNARIIEKFRKVQDRAAQLQSDVPEQLNQSSINVVGPIADLVPVPQPNKSVIKRQTVASNAGLPHYLQHPNLIETTLSLPFHKLNLSKKIRDNLGKCEFENAFAVQAALMPILLADHLAEDRQDILVSAPTGSGKTLTYALPILQVLHSRRITRLRALIIVPTRELVQQVQSTFESLSAKLGLRIEILSTTRSFSTEQDLLVNDYEPYAPSNVDILICTPGRLVDHIKSTPRFTLRDLRFLVIDEGDRLLNQSFQGWSAEIDEALKPLHDAVNSSTTDLFTTKSNERCQKLIFSATMSTDPSLLAQLNLINPALYLIQDRGVNANGEKEDLEGEDVVSKFTTPSTLLEYFVHAPDEVSKPLVLLHVIRRMNVSSALVFANSNESAQKLTSLINLCDVGRCEAFTSTLTPALRRRHLADFSTISSSSNKICFLICSDLMARGIDTNVACVINYDSSISTRQYVHRVGRTARAGHEGRAISIVEKHEGKYWWRQIGGRKIRRSHEIQRVTLFKKVQRKEKQSQDGEEIQTDRKERVIDSEHDGVDKEEEEEESTAIAKGSPGSDSNSDPDSDSDSAASDSFNTRQTSDSQPPGSIARETQIHLIDVDHDELKAVYESALAKLQDPAQHE